jgi:hypothetical protein
MLLGVRFFVQVVRDNPFPVSYLSRIFAEEITAPAVCTLEKAIVFILAAVPVSSSTNHAVKISR